MDEWVTGIGLHREDYGTHSLRRTKASIIYKATSNLRAVQILLGHRRSRAQSATSALMSKTRSAAPNARRSSARAGFLSLSGGKPAKLTNSSAPISIVPGRLVAPRMQTFGDPSTSAKTGAPTASPIASSTADGALYFGHGSGGLLPFIV